MNQLIQMIALLLAFVFAINANGQAASTTTPAKVIGVSVLATNNPFFVEMGNSMKNEGAKQGAEVIIASADLSVTRQQGQVADFISKRVSAIVLCPADSKAI